MRTRIFSKLVIVADFRQTNELFPKLHDLLATDAAKRLKMDKEDQQLLEQKLCIADEYDFWRDNKLTSGRY